MNLIFLPHEWPGWSLLHSSWGRAHTAGGAPCSPRPWGRQVPQRNGFAAQQKPSQPENAGYENDLPDFSFQHILLPGEKEAEME